MQLIKPTFLKFLVLVLLGVFYRAEACSPLNVPTVVSFSQNASGLVMNVTNNTVWLNCPYVIDMEVACNASPFSGFASCTFTSPASQFPSTPYAYPTMTFNTNSLCAGTAYKFRIRERGSGSAVSSFWSSTFTFTTPGVFVQPTLSLTANPNLVCPSQTIQLNASVINGCGTSAYTYTWVPSTGLNNPNIANPVATLTTAITYTCYTEGGPTGCWTASNSIFLNIGSGPPIPGTAVANPSTICVYNSTTLSISNFTGFAQWQSSSTGAGPWTSIVGAVTPTYVVASLGANTCFRAIVTSCAGFTAATNTICVTTNSIPVLSPSIGCTGSLTTVFIPNSPTSGQPGSVTWWPPPVSISPAGTTASYTITGNINIIAFFPDGCISVALFPLVTPSLSIVTASINCNSLGSATVTPLNMQGPYSYSWTPTAQTGSVATGLFPGIYTITVGYNNGSCINTSTTNFIPLAPFLGTVVSTDSLKCNGIPTGTASINLSGGTGSQTYMWTDGVSTQTTAGAIGLNAGVSTVTVIDAITFCSVTHTFLIQQPPPLSLTISASSPTTCAGSSITFTASNSGGTPGSVTAYTYTWTGGPPTDTYSVIGNVAGNYVFTVNSHDAHACLASQTIVGTYVPNPTLTLNSVSICPLQTGTLSVSGASSYTWNNSGTGSTFTDNPMSSQQYAVIGSALSCTNSASASIVVKPIPVPIFSSNSPICNGQALHLSVTTSTASVWTGPATYTSVVVNPTLSPAAPINSGVYHVTVTAANSCTAATQGTVTVNPTPTLTALGSTVCVTQTANLSANSLAGANYVWTGPNSFLSAQQNPFIVNPQVSASGNYSVKATSAVGCTNTAIAHITVSALPVVSFSSNSPRCFGSTLSFNANATTGGLIYNWAGPNGFNSVLQNPNISNVTVPASGNYSLTVITGPCAVTSVQAATIHPLPVPTAFNNGPVCEGKNFQLGVNNCGVGYQWFGPNFYTSTLQNPGFSLVNINHSGHYTVVVTDANTCQAASVTSVTILQNPNVNAGGALVCFGEPAQLFAVGAAGYYWMGPSNFTANVGNPIVDPTINTQVWTYTVIGTAINGCTSVATTTIGTRVLPIPTLTVTPRICVKSEIKLQGQGGQHYQWTGPLGYNSTLQNPSFIAWNIGMAGHYSLMVTDTFGCRGYTSAPVIIDSEPGGALIGEKMSGCVPFCSTYSLLASGSSSVSNTMWQIGQQSYSTPSFSYCFTKAGEYPISGSFENERNCKGTVNFIIQAYALPEADFEYSPAKPIENEGPVIFTNTTKDNNQIKWHWAFINNQGYTSNSQHTAYTFEDAGFYVVAMLVENKYGCKDTILKTIEVLPDFHVFIPNAFTPNDDGLNDLFFPVMRGVKKFNMEVFDRWGELIFASNDAIHNWDGTFRGKPCKEGVYNWKLSLLTNDGIEKYYSGSVMLYR